ncbi:response regulator [Rhodobacteraceae bacterium B1Z28]|uniref:histidine kinase n=1 Tax=Ruegeria haliotis TaxID=2747601 RepID=A0ABX2PMG0_9RHOB|nr:ATP-binding protein [Ruegeria haliotis]NVO55299.1 response regulator [Ruegeria haliotis]
MSDIAEFLSDLSIRKPLPVWRLGSLIILASVLGIAPATGVLPPDWSAGLIVAGVSFLVVALGVIVKGVTAQRSARQATAIMAAFAEQDLFPCLIANAQGNVLVANSSAQQRLQAEPGMNLVRCLRSAFANPSAILLRLQSRAQTQGRAHEDIVTQGNTIPVSVFELGAEVFCWRFHLDEQEPWGELALPVLTAGRNGVLLRLNSAVEHLLGYRPGSVDQVFLEGLPEKGEIGQMKTQDGAVSVAVSELSRSGVGRTLALVPLKEKPEDSVGTAFADLPVPIMCLSPDGTILEANRLADKLLGDHRLRDTNVSQIMQGLGHPILDWLGRTAAEEEAQRSEFLRLTRDDKDVFVQVTLSRVVNDGQVCLIAVLNDATELKTLEAQFVQGQKMQAVGQLAGGVAHDFNNLLTAISGHCDLLLLRHDQSDPNYGDLVQINQNANRAAALVSQLLAFSRKQTLRPEVLDLRDTISDLIHLLNRLVGEKVQLTLSHDPVLKPVRADKRQLEQVLMNLVVNARDAMPEGGEIRIETEVARLTQPLRRDRATVQPGEYVTVKVIDSGMGIPADKLQKVFEPFYTTKRTGEGTGLGLSTAYGIVKQTGGFIFVDSAPGQGAEFSVLLPVCAVTAKVEPAVAEPSDTQGARPGEGVVLLVEDEAPVRAFATRALRLKGYTVLEAESAEDALRVLDDPDLCVDVFVTDVVMPGMDGPTWVRKAMATRPDVRVVFVSGYTEGAFGDSGPEIANSTFLPKPFSLNQLTEAVFQQLN